MVAIVYLRDKLSQRCGHLRARIKQSLVLPYHSCKALRSFGRLTCEPVYFIGPDKSLKERDVLLPREVRETAEGGWPQTAFGRVCYPEKTQFVARIDD